MPSRKDILTYIFEILNAKQLWSSNTDCLITC